MSYQLGHRQYYHSLYRQFQKIYSINILKVYLSKMSLTLWANSFFEKGLLIKLMEKHQGQTFIIDRVNYI